MHGLMMDTPLLISAIMRFADANFGQREIVSITADSPLHRYTYTDAFRRARQAANALDRLGVQQGDRLATLAWNDHRHFELYYAISCFGAVCHTVNPRLFSEQIEYIINHAEDQYVFTDVAFVTLLEQMQDQLETVKGFIVLIDAEHMPETKLRNAMCYENLLAQESDNYDWPELEERTASAMCYTSGTTGNPKGVLFNHRATLLHAYAEAMPDVFNLSVMDCVLPVVPMFHVNAWGTPYAVPMVGAKLVLPGPKMGDSQALHELMEREGVTLSLGVPTVWLGLLAYLDESGKTLSSLKRVCIGGAACPASVIEKFRDQHKVYVHQAWGMTEMTPLGTFNTLKPGMLDLPQDELIRIQTKQGRGVCGVEMKITDDGNNDLPWDGKAVGTLKVRGPWVCNGYFGGEKAHIDGDGWLDTGDVATIDPEGFMFITDRTKDVIKSGGEWISSITLENTAVDHPQVVEAAVIGVVHSKWGERPLLIVVRQLGADFDKTAMLSWFDGKVAKWWIPDDVVFVDELPHTATGKIRKVELREQFHDYELPST